MPQRGCKMDFQTKQIIAGASILVGGIIGLIFLGTQLTEENSILIIFPMLGVSFGGGYVLTLKPKLKSPHSRNVK